ncbi:MAG TPA: hypothetical protein VGR32_05575 [Brevundimonas sp.]|jgi:hypothetical protein|uniref:hypothetical protein n=1 Tax=Brevundimonas sp. TaxID=1871086 RepID=UPI002DF44B15|nr:hypothetical protein [Brevundimonas sp.]
MNVYQFHFLTGDGGRPTLDFSECGDDAEAARAAFRHLRQHRSCSGVEVYDGQRLVVTVAVPPSAEDVLPDAPR